MARVTVVSSVGVPGGHTGAVDKPCESGPEVSTWGEGPEGPWGWEIAAPDKAWLLEPESSCSRQWPEPLILS